MHLCSAVLVLQHFTCCNSLAPIILLRSGRSVLFGKGLRQTTFGRKQVVLRQTSPVLQLATWDEETSPFEIIRHFAKKEVSTKQIKDVLKTEMITSLQDLKNISFINRLVSDYEILSADDDCKFYDAVSDALKRSRTTLEAALGGNKDYDPVCISAGAYAYALGAVSVDPTELADRGNNFTVVSGPSGSGKTFFSIWRLPALLISKANENEIFTLHFLAKDVINLERKPRPHNLPKKIAALVQERIENKISGVLIGGAKSSNLLLLIIIDEAGSSLYKEYFDTASKIEKIVSVIKSNVKFKFEKGVHVAVAGTGIETATYSISSLADTTKFRMQPWTSSNFVALVNVSSHTNKDLVIDVVKRFPILQALTSNARCAFYLLNSMTEYAFLHKNRVKAFINIIISTVVASYIRSNVLSILKLAADKWIVAQSVFKEIDNALRKPNDAVFPEFGDLEHWKDLLPAVTSLISVNVESRNGKTVFMGENVISLSMTPALAIVLANLLNVEAKIAWDWQAFESTLTLCEWKKMIANWNGPAPRNVDKTIVELRTPFPIEKGNAALDGETTFVVPLVNSYTVVRNGRMAAYADVIAPYHLAQAKFSEKASQVNYLDLSEELGKMGLTTAEDWRLQQAATSALYDMWGSSEEIVQGSVDSKRSSEKLNLNYPYNSLVELWIQEKPAEVVCRLNNDKTLVIVGKEKKEVLKDFHDDHPVIAVFATNCDKIVIKGVHGVRRSMSIFPDDVDREGRLIEKVLPDDIGLRKNVEVQFFFF